MPGPSQMGVGVGAGGALAPPVFGQTVNPISTRGADYSHLFNKRGVWNKRGGGAKVAKTLNVELGINEEGGIFGKN